MKTTITKANINDLRKDLQDALKLVEAKWDGFNVEVGFMKYNADSCEVKLEIAKKDSSGLVMDRFAQAFKHYAYRYDLEPDDLGKTFRNTRGTDYRLTGINTRCSKYPICATKLSDGREYKLPRDFAKTATRL
jgi:hypothetical protein|tara:strand:+ start:3294 stop:3692 length:399 start_codon:yes stop_codon:yes gene_type:complete